MFTLHLPVPILSLLNGPTLRILTIIMVSSMNVFGSPLSQQSAMQSEYLSPAADINNSDDLVQETNTGNFVMDNFASQRGSEPFLADYPTYNMQTQNTIPDDYNSPTLSDYQLNLLTLYLTQVLTESWRDNELPLLYIEEFPPSSSSSSAAAALSTAIKEHHPQLQPHHHHANHLNLLDDDSFVENTAKRTRYYRKYPWKRQNSRARMYNAENKYMCQPSREDVYQLLLALHESRSGNRNRTVNFCNRRRPAAAIYTNIRFLGRRRK